MTLKPKPISDHALLRFMERCCGVPVDTYRAQLEAIAQPFLDMKARSVPLPDGHWLLIEHGTVVTVTPSRPLQSMRNTPDPWDEKPHWKALNRKRRR